MTAVLQAEMDDCLAAWAGERRRTHACDAERGRSGAEVTRWRSPPGRTSPDQRPLARVRRLLAAGRFRVSQGVLLGRWHRLQGPPGRGPDAVRPGHLGGSPRRHQGAGGPRQGPPAPWESRAALTRECRRRGSRVQCTCGRRWSSRLRLMRHVVSPSYRPPQVEHRSGVILLARLNLSAAHSV